MTRALTLIASLALSGAVVLAHNGNQHVRGVVTQVSATSVTVEGQDHATQTLTITDKTTFQKAGKPAHLSDVKAGDRVVIDVPEKTKTATLIQIGTAPKAAAQKESATGSDKHPAR
jgi:hypothetical protein